MRRKRRRWWVWWWGWNIWCLLRMWGCKFFCFLGLGVGGDGIFVYLPDVGMERVGIEEEEQEEKEGNHLRKEPVPYCVNYKESVQ
jgi:hypothetical protein